MSLTSELLPDPDTPVTQTNTPVGISTSICLRLLCDAPTTRTTSPRSWRRLAGTSIFRFPDRYFPVTLCGRSDDVCQRPRRHNIAATHARPGAEIDEVVGRSHRFFIMLDDNDRVAHVAQVVQCIEQPFVIARMQANRWLVQNVQHTDQTRPNLTGQSNALRFTSRQRRGGAIERQIVEPHIQQEPQACTDLLEHFRGDQLPRLIEFQVLTELSPLRGPTGGRVQAAIGSVPCAALA